VKKSVSLLTFGILLTISWILPNHYPPWLAFHSDAWTGLILLLSAWFVFIKSSEEIIVPNLAVGCIIAIVLIIIQFLLQKIYFLGTAFLGVTYLSGFFLAIVLGRFTEKANTHFAPDVIFLAVGTASIFSVGFQFYQWLNLDIAAVNFWLLGKTQGRPFANLGQPNQLATLLLWGILAIAWGYFRKQIGPSIALIAVGLLLFGVALTGSRTAWLGIILIFSFACFWRNIWSNKKIVIVAGALCIFLGIFVVVITWLNVALDFNSGKTINITSTMSAHVRLRMWRIFIDAIWLQPIFGYGFDQVKLAEMVAAPFHPAIDVLFAQSHNLFLDLIIWFGLPIGLFFSVGLLFYLKNIILSVKSAENAVMCLILVIIGNHAMFELPLHYAYFLLPVGVILGVLHTSSERIIGSQAGIVISKSFLLMLLLIFSTGYIMLIKEYFKVEQSYRELRLEFANFQEKPKGNEPDVLMLTHFQEFIRIARMEPEDLVSDVEVIRAKHVASSIPSSAGIYKLAIALSLRGENEEATLWLRRLCKVMGKAQCQAVKLNWQERAITNSSLKNVNWAMIDDWPER